jgi:hypothetical protein
MDFFLTAQVGLFFNISPVLLLWTFLFLDDRGRASAREEIKWPVMDFLLEHGRQGRKNHNLSAEEGRNWYITIFFRP